jgi:hypothetical protein
MAGGPPPPPITALPPIAALPPIVAPFLCHLPLTVTPARRPITVNDLAMQLAKSIFSSGALIRMPSFSVADVTMPLGSRFTLNVWLKIAVAIWLDRAFASGFIPYELTDTLSLAVPLQALPISSCWLGVNFLHPTSAPSCSRFLVSMSDLSLAPCARSLASSASIFAPSASRMAIAARSYVSAACLWVSARICSSWPRIAVSELETYPSNTPSARTPTITNIRPIAPAGICQLNGFGSSTGNFLLSRVQFLRLVHVSPISRMHPSATTPVEISSRVNHLLLSRISESRTASTTGADVVNKQDRELKWLLKFLALMFSIAVCEVLYISFRSKV